MITEKILKNKQDKQKKKCREENLSFKDFDRMMREGHIYKRCKGGALKQIK